MPFAQIWQRPINTQTGRMTLFAAAILCSLPHANVVRGADKSVHWPSFRGHNASGIADGFPLPSEWDVETGRNIRWKSAIPGLGYSAPVVWGDRVYVTTAVNTASDKPEVKVGLYGDIMPVVEDVAHSFRVLCLDKKSGKVIWDMESCRGVPKIKRHPKASHANSTPATDGTCVVACFGAEGLYCYELNGKLRWKKDLGPLDSGFYMVPDAQWGFASSPIIVDGKVILQCDVQKDSHIVAFDQKDGRELWRTKRDEVPTWSTPAVVSVGGENRLFCNGYKHIGGYRVADGKEVWKLEGGGDIPVPTPVVWNDLVFITNAHGMMAPIYAIAASANGELKAGPDNQGTAKGGDGAIRWWLAAGGNYMQTPIVYRDHLYMCMDNGVLSCHEPATGKRLYRKRLAGGKGFTASAVGGDGKLYFTGETGDIFVVPATGKFEVMASNSMNEVCMATPAISEGLLLVRTQTQLVAIGADAGK